MLVNGGPVARDMDLVTNFNLNKGLDHTEILPKPVHIAPEEFSNLLLHAVPPVWPDILKTASFQGTVVLHIALNEQGHIIDLGVVSGPELVQRAALSAVSQWQYRPCILDGKPVPAESTVSVEFKR